MPHENRTNGEKANDEDRSALKQAQSEPVGMVVDNPDDYGRIAHWLNDVPPAGAKLYTEAPTQGEPVVWFVSQLGGLHVVAADHIPKYLFGLNSESLANALCRALNEAKLYAATPKTADAEWQSKAAAWLRLKADEQEESCKQYPGHAIAYPAWGVFTRRLRLLADELAAAPRQAMVGATQAIPDGWQLIRSDLVAFLDGSGEIDGLAFGEADTAKRRPRYWWRALLKDTPGTASQNTPKE